MTLLYLGLKSPQKEGVIHYPVIRIVPLAMEEPPPFTDLIFTSQTAVGLWPFSLEGKRVFAIGKATASMIKGEVLVPEEATQEGMIALLGQMDLRKRSFCYPHSKRARPLLREALRKWNVPCFAFDLYDVVIQKGEPLPDLAQIEEIVFTSPSTVDGFLQIFGALPLDKKLTAIGPVTEAALLRFSSFLT